jgi:hypothetical protein
MCMCEFIIKINIFIFIIMDNSNSLSSAILQSSEASFPSLSTGTSSSSSGSSGGIFDSLKEINTTTWVVIILILAFLGFNIFVYLAKGTQDISNFFGPIIQKIFGTTVGVTSQTVDVAAEGTKAVVGGTANVINTSLSAVQDITPNGASSSIKSQSIQNDISKVNQYENNALNKALNASKQTQQKGGSQDYEPHESESSGWCYIGEDRGYRSCAQVGVDDKCMSGDIFPSQELCMNPNLRA